MVSLSSAIKPASLGLYNVYLDALLKLKAKSPSAKMAAVEVDEASRNLRKFLEEGRAVEVGDYLILYDLGSPWYTTKLHFIEELTIRFQRVYNNPVTDAVQAMEKLARMNCAQFIAVGDTQIGLMTPYYLEAGYTPLGSQLFKEIDYGVCPQDHWSPGSD